MSWIFIPLLREMFEPLLRSTFTNVCKRDFDLSGSFMGRERGYSVKWFDPFCGIHRKSNHLKTVRTGDQPQLPYDSKLKTTETQRTEEVSESTQCVLRGDPGKLKSRRDRRTGPKSGGISVLDFLPELSIRLFPIPGV